MAKPITASDPVCRGDHTEQPETVSAGSGCTASANTTVPSNELSECPQRPAQLTQQEKDLLYYRKFVEDLVAVMRDASSDSVTELIALIRSGASHNEIKTAVERVLN